MMILGGDALKVKRQLMPVFDDRHLLAERTCEEQPIGHEHHRQTGALHVRNAFRLPSPAVSGV